MLLPIYIVGISCFLLGGFLIVTYVERKQGRLFGATRTRLDAYVARISFIVRHIDWSSFVKHQLQTTLEKVLHDIAHTILMAIRMIERWLTRMVRSLRERRGEIAARTEGVPLPLRVYKKALIFFRLRLLRKKNKDDSMGGS